MSALKGLLSIFSDFCLEFMIIFIMILIPFLISCLVFLLINLKKGLRFKKRSVNTKLHYARRRSKLLRFYVDFPRQLMSDVMTSDPDEFDIFGVHIFAGEQGSGKTIAALHFIKMILERNPKCKIASNIDIDFQNDVIGDWRDILNLNNGIYGQVIMLDEIQNWFSSNESRNFPVEMLTEITQQRKQRKIVVGTSQVFTRISKPIREQITLLYLPITVFGCLTFVRVYKLALNDDGTIREKRLRKCYFFVHDPELRSCYDTYQKVQRLSVVGFQDRDKQLRSDVVSKKYN